MDYPWLASMIPGCPGGAAEIPALVRHRLGGWWLLMRWRYSIPIIWSIWRSFSSILGWKSCEFNISWHILTYPEISWHLDISWHPVICHSLTPRGSSKLWVPSSSCSSSESIRSEAKVCYAMMTRIMPFVNTVTTEWSMTKAFNKSLTKTVKSVTSICFSEIRNWEPIEAICHARSIIATPPGGDKSCGALIGWHWPNGIPRSRLQVGARWGSGSDPWLCWGHLADGYRMGPLILRDAFCSRQNGKRLTEKRGFGYWFQKVLQVKQRLFGTHCDD